MVKAKVGRVLSAHTSLSQPFRGANETGKGLNSAKDADGSSMKLNWLPRSNPINETFNFTSRLQRLLTSCTFHLSLSPTSYVSSLFALVSSWKLSVHNAQSTQHLCVIGTVDVM